ncbi:glycosyltransferase [Leucobacter ruminantium]|uniref:D-inositol 3-phosphate glycosyltransferase n=1 Tax=Leucobacter ruminantium TaxID=1289170 RepID=A0A939LWN8_9MICO|nr:glycosyltransferase [Leucobacter ruminantium]MBO1804313.1 glycosyltransferase [Leucobacter ruminantium]
MRILLWHVHGAWSDGFLRGEHEYLIPADRGADLALPRGGARTVDPAALRETDVDIVVLQRVEELELAERLLGRRLGSELPAVFVEHNTPKERPVTERHFLAEQSDIPVVHVTHFNRLVWDCGRATTRVIEHGIPDPGPLYTGELPSLGLVVNEPVRRGRVTGTDLIPRFAEAAPIDCFGIDTDLLPAALELGEERLRVVGDLPTARLHRELARRRVYLHTVRWTSLGLSLLEAMHLAMPVLVFDTTEASRAVPPEAGAISADPDDLVRAARELIADPEEARRRGAAARSSVRERYGLERFHAEWDALLHDVVESATARRRRRSGPRPQLQDPSPARTTALLEGADR